MEVAPRIVMIALYATIDVLNDPNADPTPPGNITPLTILTGTLYGASDEDDEPGRFSSSPYAPPR